MVWGGPKEKRKELEAGNPFVKDWHDEALKIVEATMQEYWEEPDQQPASTNHSTLFDTSAANDKTLESEFDCHFRHLIQWSSSSNSGSCAAELHRYLSDWPVDIMKDMDIIEWWSVPWFFYSCILHC